MNTKEQRTAYIALYRGEPACGVFTHERSVAWQEILRQLDIDADTVIARGYQVGKIVYEVVTS